MEIHGFQLQKSRFSGISGPSEKKPVCESGIRFVPGELDTRFTLDVASENRVEKNRILTSIQVGKLGILCTVIERGSMGPLTSDRCSAYPKTGLAIPNEQNS